MVINRTQIGFRDQWYLKAGLELLVPRRRSFQFNVDTGLGAFVGFGRYIGRNNVFDLALEWDVYPALTVKYRLEAHFEHPFLTIGPVIGYKKKILNLSPFDNFLDNLLLVKEFFYLFGGIIGFPAGRSLVTIELLFMVNEQAFIVGNAWVHLFF